MTFASWPYDRLEALKDGVVVPKGIDLRFLPSHPGDTFLRMLGKREFESSEMSMSSLLMTKELDDPFVAVPVFTSRTFRHNGIFVHADSGIKEPRDLIGKKMGLPEYQITSTLWMRGLLQHEYDVRPNQIKWYAERWGRGMHSHGSAVGFKPPEGVSISTIPKSEDQISLLRKRKLDAAFLIQELPSSLCRSSLRSLPSGPDSKIRRLFENYKEVERDYYRRTGLFPIMHTVVVRRDVYEKHPWVAKSLYAALSESKRKFYEVAREWELFSFPWIRAEMEELRELMGDDPYPYGLRSNRKVLEAICQYSFEQGLTKRQAEPQSLFAPELVNT
jgi:4,5-dihydroxyphthalate decarboxylase